MAVSWNFAARIEGFISKEELLGIALHIVIPDSKKKENIDNLLYSVLNYENTKIDFNFLETTTLLYNLNKFNIFLS